MPDVALNSTLHHCASIVVFDETFPAGLGQVMILSEALLPEVLNGIVVCVGQEVMQLLVLSVILQFVHKTGSIALYLLLSRDCEEYNLSKLLRVEWSEYAPSENLRFLPLLLFDNDHGFMHTVHHKPNDICSRHSRKLLSDNVLQVD